MADMTMYTTPWCGYCKNLKTQMNKAGLDYREVNIEATPDAAAKVARINGGNQVVPTVEFADGTTLTNPSLAQVQEKLAALAN